MARILIHMLREHGHLWPTLALTSALTSAGHIVEYLLTPSWEGLCRRHGLRMRPYLEAIYPPGSESAWERMSAEQRNEDFEARLQQRTDFLLDGGLADVYTRAQPDLVLGDVFDVSIPMAARAAGVRLLQLSTSLYQGRLPGVGPLTSSVRYEPTESARDQAGRAWARLQDERRARAKTDWYLDYVERLIEAHQFPRSEINWEGAVAPEFPQRGQLVLCPRAFELPVTVPDRVCYDVTSLVERDEQLEGPLRAWCREAPFVYCAFGTQVCWRPSYRALFDRVVGVARRRPELRMLVATGAAWQQHYAEGAPPNVRVVERVPQHAVLREARAMISVGGLGSIKECIYFGVPMVLLPNGEGYDPPGNAVRATYHGLAQVLDPTDGDEDDDEHALVRALDAVLRGDHDAAVAKMRAAFIEAEAHDSGVARIEQALSEPP